MKENTSTAAALWIALFLSDPGNFSLLMHFRRSTLFELLSYRVPRFLISMIFCLV